MTSRESSSASTSAEQASVEKHKRLKQLLEAALDLPAADRESFLERECAGDAALRQQARELLELYSDTDLEPASEPEQIGPYRLITELGAGGMGVVYLAQREDGFSRTVAVKVMR